MNRLLVCSVTLMCVPLVADTIELKSGEKIEGKFKQAVADGATILVGGQPVTFPLDKVQAIFLGDVPNAPRNKTEPAPLSEAIDALKGLRSVTDSGIAYRDYASRVLDTKVKVDKSLGTVKTDDPKSAVIRLAMQNYILAARAWEAGLTKSSSGIDWVTTLQDPDIANCAAVKEMFAKDDRDKAAHAQFLLTDKRRAQDEKDWEKHERQQRSYHGQSEPTPAESQAARAEVHFSFNPTILWSCAAAKLDTL